ncbi:bifunctional 4-hydroxy-2-oxoglutarate aldolase/2-dehydro-3-deoxy-phosphogluconate aldolase [Motiliproteus sp. MSK22-1]|uniref:bifunctional 4-hydroxy-2-oxoglutarate aldolase/2-dehydro-3-deoxy-phosphogluconate aldolase n=1 Tax=Motiliproteus sp. MSK22-1 TaxID=1897630 RepID=UPI000976C894|nr:bifunctional 4-hydroxy-2-oxoglutarate aldolase/2-dehydro-3-deoxy-phosphogluconate aldolase [Motiliproteus sp. MSK22-1]OMH25952.1 keto-deoxy-phosphogluconate aldolase [Motiliproteus sp. MSK22-1]
MSNTVNEILETSPVMPVLVIDEVEDAVPLAKALVSGGLKVLEITLRTEAALDAIRAISQDVEGALIGAGTITTPAQLQQVRDAGCVFAISPGATPALLKAGKEIDIHYIPAISTASELMVGMEAGYTAFKFFPAESSGGVGALRSFAGPMPEVTFCPTGGIGPDNFCDYLSLSNVACVGGSWVVPSELVKKKDWEGIKALAAGVVQQAARIR